MFAYVGYADAAPASLGKLGSLWRKRTVNHSYAFRLQGLHNRNEIAVGGDENGHIVIVVPSQPHHVGCNGSIYTLFLGASHISAAVHAVRDYPATRRAFWACGLTSSFSHPYCHARGSRKSVERPPAQVLLIWTVRVIRAIYPHSLIFQRCCGIDDAGRLLRQKVA